MLTALASACSVSHETPGSNDGNALTGNIASSPTPKPRQVISVGNSNAVGSFLDGPFAAKSATYIALPDRNGNPELFLTLSENIHECDCGRNFDSLPGGGSGNPNCVNDWRLIKVTLSRDTPAAPVDNGNYTIIDLDHESAARQSIVTGYETQGGIAEGFGGQVVLQSTQADSLGTVSGTFSVSFPSQLGPTSVTGDFTAQYCGPAP